MPHPAGPPQSFESYWHEAQPRFIAMARKEWEALADGPIQGVVQIGLEEGCSLDIPLHIVINGLSQEAVAAKIKALLEASVLVSTSDEHDSEEWRKIQRTVQQRLNLGDYDFSEGALMAVDIYIGKQV